MQHRPTTVHDCEATAKDVKDDKYDEFCKEVTADKALHKFWQLYGAMKNKHNAELQRTAPTPKDKGPFSIKNT